jgi:hypothetical protein
MIKARAFKSGYTDSDVAAAIFVLSGGLPPAPWANGAGDITYDFAGQLYIWDISGTYSDDALGADISYTVTQDDAGKITGYGNASYSYGGATLYMTYNITGTVIQKNGLASVKLKFKFKGTVYDGVDTYRFSATETVTAEINSNSKVISGSVKIRVSVQGYGSTSEVVPFSQSLPADMDGTAVLSLSCDSDGKNVVGTGQLALSSGDIYNFSVKGKYNAKYDESSLILKGDQAAKKNSLKIKVDGSDGSMKSLNGKVLGQKLVQ